MFWRRNLFPAVVDEARFRRQLERPAAATRYCILFTPRTGSSWLTDIARQTGRLGHPGEHFNPTFLPRMAQSFDARTRDDLVEALLRRRNVGGVFGMEITYFQLKTVFRSERAFLRAFGDARFFWLIREDIVLQAISLMKKQQTRIGHNTQAPAAARAEAESRVVKRQVRVCPPRPRRRPLTSAAGAPPSSARVPPRAARSGAGSRRGNAPPSRHSAASRSSDEPR